jgi:hypothetical protein
LVEKKTTDRGGDGDYRGSASPHAVILQTTISGAGRNGRADLIVSGDADLLALDPSAASDRRAVFVQGGPLGSDPPSPADWRDEHELRSYPGEAACDPG